MEPLLGSIILLGGDFEPRGWAFCNGQVLEICQYPALYSPLGTTHCGDGITSFRLPDLRGRVPVHAGSGVGLSPLSPGEAFGSETVTLTAAPAAPHDNDFVVADVLSAFDRGEGDMPSRSHIHSETSGPTQSPKPRSIALTKGGQPHGNMPSSLCVDYIIAREGIYPSHT